MADLGKVMVTPKGAYSTSVTYEILDLVTYNGSSFIALKNVKGIVPINDGVNWQLHGQGYPGNASGVAATDNQGVLGTAGALSNSQALIDAIADRVMTRLLEKSKLVNNGQTTEPGFALDARYGKTLVDQITQVNSDLANFKTYHAIRGSDTYTDIELANEFIRKNIPDKTNFVLYYTGSLYGSDFYCTGQKADNDYLEYSYFTYVHGRPPVFVRKSGTFKITNYVLDSDLVAPGSLTSGTLKIGVYDNNGKYYLGITDNNGWVCDIDVSRHK